jgi:hypothetical protein
VQTLLFGTFQHKDDFLQFLAVFGESVVTGKVFQDGIDPLGNFANDFLKSFSFADFRLEQLQMHVLLVHGFPAVILCDSLPLKTPQLLLQLLDSVVQLPNCLVFLVK